MAAVSSLPSYYRATIMFTATILSSLLAATVLAAPAPQQEFNSYDEFRQLLLAEPGRHMEEIDGMYVLLDGANATIATAGPKYNWAMHTAIDEKQCLQYSKVLMLPNNTLSKPMNDGALFAFCNGEACLTPGMPGKCATIHGCTLCSSRSVCI